MTRALFGGTTDDWLFGTVSGFGGALVSLNAVTVTGTCWDSQTNGTQYTDLLDANGSPITVLTVDGSVMPRFSGPDGVVEMWVDFGDGRYLLEARNQAAAAAASQSAAASSATSSASSATSAASSATAAAASAATAHDISNIDTSDGVVTALIDDSASTTTAALNAAFAQKALLPAPRLRTWGHSYMHGSTTSTGGCVIGVNDMATLMAAGFNVALDNQAIAGASLYSHLSQADWASIDQYETRPGKFSPLGGLYALLYGLNDAVQLGHTSTQLIPYQHSLRATIARLRCAAIFEDSDPSMSYGGAGTWVVGSGTAGNSGGSYHYNATAGATFTITTPAAFPGGTVNVFLDTWNDGGGATVTGPASLGSPVLNTTSYSGTDSRRTGVMRIKNVPAGAATYTFTTSSVTGSAGAIPDCWGWEPAEAHCAIVAVIAQPHVLDYSSETGTGFGPVTDTGVDTLNSIQSGVAAEFGDHCVFVDTSGIDGDLYPQYWETGNVHPNASGHAYIADQTIAAVNAILTADKTQLFPADLNSSTAAVAASVFTSFTPTIAGNGTTLGNGTVTGLYIRDANGMVDFAVTYTVGSTDVIGTQLTVSLPAAAVSGTQPGVWDGHIEASGAVKFIRFYNNTTTTVLLRATDGTNVTSTSPVTNAAGNKFIVTGRYRAA